MKSKKLILAGIVIALIFMALLVSLFGFGNDGVSKYSGAEKVAAQNAVQFEKNTSSNKSTVWSISVTNVEPISNNDRSQICINGRYSSDDPSDPRHYVVSLKVKSLENLSGSTVKSYGCVLMSFDPGYYQK